MIYWPIMKKITLLFLFVLSFDLLFAQSSWEKATKTADSLDATLKFEQALSYRVKAVELAATEPDSIRKMLFGLKLFTRARRDFSLTEAKPEAYTLMKNAVDTLIAAGANAERIYEASWELSQVAFDLMYRGDEAAKYLDTSLSYHAKTQKKDTLFVIKAMEFQGYMKILARDYQNAIEICENALALYDQYTIMNENDYNLKAKLYYNLAIVHNYQFLDFPQKEYLYTVEAEKALARADEPDIEHLVLINRRLALYERDYRNYENAKGYMNKAMDLYEKHKEKLKAKIGFKLELTLYRALIVIFMESGGEQEMLNVFARIESIIEKNELDETEKGLYKGALKTIINYYLYEDPNPEVAKKYISKVSRVHLNTDKSNLNLDSYDRGIQLQLATAYFLEKEYQKALNLLTEVKQLDKFTLNLQALFFELKAQCLLGLGKPDAAVKEINRLAGVISEENSTFQFPQSDVENFTPGFVISNAEAMVRLAESWQTHHGRHTMEEEKLYWMALAQFESNLGNHILTKDLKDSFDKIVAGIMEAALTGKFSVEENNRLLTFMETVESQSLINSFLLNREVAGNASLYKLVEEEQYLRSQITRLKKSYQKSKDDSLKDKLFEKELELKTLHQKLTAQHHEYGLLSKPNIKTETLTQRNIIKFTAVGDDLFKIHLYNGNVDYQRIPGYQALKNEIKTFLLDISNLHVDVNKLKAQAGSIYKKLFKDTLSTSVPAVIIPDDILYYLPFELLVERGQYLLANHIIYYASNFSLLNTAMFEETNKKNKEVVFFVPEYSGTMGKSQLAVRGAPYALLGAQQEVKEIARFVPGTAYTGEEATKAAFRSLANKANNISILHLAMHSNLNDEDPELSSLVFSDSEKDYEMYISELYGLNFDADLAVLSACNTGIGGFKDGGSLVSMHHAFTAAGIPSTIASLWSAPDQSTREIMVSFYKKLKEGLNKAQALRLAKLNYLENAKSEKLRHPFYWAGFILSGNNSPVYFPAPFWERPLGITLLSLLVLSGIIVYFKKRKRNSA